MYKHTLNKEKDIYFELEYGKLYEKMENGKAELFHFKNELGEIKNLFIKREIPIKIDDKIYYDLITPYGYGGPTIYNCEEKNKKKLTNDFAEAFEQYCFNNKIVSEFIRFYPLDNTALYFSDIYKLELDRKTLGTNLKEFENPFQEEFSKSCRKNIRKALKRGLTYEIEVAPDDISSFKEIYYSTMDRNGATNFYYFDDKYFQSIVANFKKNIITVSVRYEGKIIAQGLYFIYNGIIHIHLSGTLSEYLHLSPAYVLRYAVTIWGKENGYSMIHHGGGRTSSEEDGLFSFKKSFAKNTEFEFWIGKSIWNKTIYNKLVELSDVDSENTFFPLYRS